MNSPIITFQRLREVDLPLLGEWLRRPHVVEWWGGDDEVPDIQNARQAYFQYMEGLPNVTPYIALLAGKPIGFIQSYVAMKCGDGWWADETDPGVLGIDQFLCDEDQLGRGLGTRMVRAFVERLLAEPHVSKVQTDPHPLNLRAIRCYEKAGFRPIGEIETPDGRALLLVVEKCTPTGHNGCITRAMHTSGGEVVPSAAWPAGARVAIPLRRVET